MGIAPSLAPPENVPSPSPPDADLLFREAKQRERRRRLLWLGAVVIVSVCVAALIVGLTRGGVPSKHPSVRPSRTHKITPAGPTTSGIVPQRPSSLAIGPNGNVYIADDIRNQILERLPDGRFRVVVGNGTKGYSGDGGSATEAEIDDPGGMAVSSDGTLYFADSGNDRVRAVSPTGVITTVVGDGQNSPWVPDGTPALDAALAVPTAVTFSADRPVLHR